MTDHSPTLDIHFHTCKRHHNLIRQVDRETEDGNFIINWSVEAIIGEKCYCPAWDDMGINRTPVAACDAVVMVMMQSKRVKP